MSQHHTYIIGEIGQNHNGSVDIAKLIIDAAARPIREDLFGMDLPRMDAVKLTKRDLSQELSASQMSREYNSPHSFGKTYGEHRAKLELNDEQHFELYQYAKAQGLDFVETLCAVGCLSMTKYFMPDRLKVASRDLTNLPLLNALAETQIPIILSTGMGGFKEIDDALSTITRHHENISILHCVSEYPTRPENANLLSIKALRNTYPNYAVGYSDHTIGISAPVSAVAMGAKIIEKHITLDRRMKGTDQAGSLGVDGIQRMVRDIRLIERSMGVEDVFIADSTVSAKHKLERSIATNREIKAGETIQESDLHLLSPGDGFKWHELEKVVGKTATKTIPADEIIYQEHLS
ncbi:MAG: shikimate dehydrogenase [Sphingomonadales bacterium]|nr:shikimate dehydrogenase [Sphingomonadales bacterium]